MSRLLVEFATAADAAERASKVVTIGGDGERCQFCGTTMRRTEYRLAADGPVALVRDICPKCKAQTRALKPRTDGGWANVF